MMFSIKIPIDTWRSSSIRIMILASLIAVPALKRTIRLLLLEPVYAIDRQDILGIYC
jgi:hypothetical protein